MKVFLVFRRNGNFTHSVARVYALDRLDAIVRARAAGLTCSSARLAP